MTPADPKFGDKVNITLNASLLSNRTFPDGSYIIELQEDNIQRNYSVNFTNGIGKIENYTISVNELADKIECRFILTDKYNAVWSNRIEFNSLKSIFSFANFFKRGDCNGVHSKVFF